MDGGREGGGAAARVQAADYDGACFSMLVGGGGVLLEFGVGRRRGGQRWWCKIEKICRGIRVVREGGGNGVLWRMLWALRPCVLSLSTTHTHLPLLDFNRWRVVWGGVWDPPTPLSELTNV